MLLEWVVKPTKLQFHGVFCLVDGVAMGSPAAPLMADVCMNLRYRSDFGGMFPAM